MGDKVDLAADAVESVGELPPAAPQFGQQSPPTHKPSLGRVVHYVLPVDSIRAGEHRAATIAQCWGDTTVNLSVNKGQSDDFTNSAHEAVSGCFAGHHHSAAVALVGSVQYGENNPDGTYPPGTWHWPERV